MSENLNVCKISFSDCRAYWLSVDHFRDPNKHILEFVKRLGPFETKLCEPSRQAYGLFDGERLVGVTQLVQWSDEWLRYRTINILKEYRGQDNGWYLLKTAYHLDWKHMPYLFGWVRRDHVGWAKAKGFTFINDNWQDDHVGMTREMKC
jgi:hypothetical protein